MRPGDSRKRQCHRRPASAPTVGLGRQPTPTELDALKDLQAKIRGITCTVVERNRPVWMAFDNLMQVYRICPNLAGTLLHDYRETKQIDAFHIYQRKPHH
jgi:hypothetical protein